MQSNSSTNYYVTVPMCIDKTESNKRICPRKLTPNLKHQELHKQKFTGKKYYGKGCMSSKK